MMKPFAVNVGIFILLVAGLLVFEFNLELESFEGLAFKLYLIYGSIALFLINAVIAFFFAVRNQRRTARDILIGGFVVGAVGTVIGYLLRV